MKIRVLLAVVFAALLSGCAGPTDSSGWHSSQKSEFLKILKTDKYLSICDQQTLYQKVRSSGNTQLMTKLLVGYADNLANGCLVNARGFNAYRQKVSTTNIQNKLRGGQSIEQILKPYVPEYKQFSELSVYYRALQKNGNASPELLHSMRLNIERVKMMKPGLGHTYALVNIPEYIIRVIEKDKESVNMRVVVGTKKNQTPIFSADLKYITLNPTWNVPDSIARNEIIPKTLRNPGYLKSHRLVMRKDYNLDSPALSFNSVNARAYVGGKGPVPFKFIEVPSSRNALGRVKFIFPNHHSVYMHDTPAKSLFKRKTRAFSHGCVRLHKPKDMLAFISKNYTAHSAADVQAKYNSKKTHYLKITKRLPVHTVYLTTYVDENGKLLSFGDPYGYDKSQQLNF
jgi:murein L,D-transpeptidase YcbB/YkuD